MADAFKKLSRMVDSCGEPKLSTEEVEDLLYQFRVADADGVLPGEADYVLTYSLRAAAREGWKLKAAKAAELQSTDLDGDRMSANQIFEHCERMVRRYSSSTSVSVGPAAEE